MDLTANSPTTCCNQFWWDLNNAWWFMTFNSSIANPNSKTLDWGTSCSSVCISVCLTSLNPCRGKSSNMGTFPNRGRCNISYQEVLHSLFKNVNDQAHETVLCNQSINGQLLRTSVLTGRLCFGALWSFCLSLNCDSWTGEGKILLWFRINFSILLSVEFIKWILGLTGDKYGNKV